MNKHGDTTKLKRLRYAYSKYDKDDPYYDLDSLDVSDPYSVAKRFEFVVDPQYNQSQWVGTVNDGADLLYEPNGNHLYGLIDKIIKYPHQGNHNLIETMMKHNGIPLVDALNMWIWPDGDMRVWSENPARTEHEKNVILTNLKKLRELLDSLGYDTSKLRYYDSWTGDEDKVNKLLEGNNETIETWRG